MSQQSSESGRLEQGAPAGRYLTFQVAGEEYAVAAKRVEEVIRLQETTPVPLTPSCGKGVITVQGRLIPVVDLRTHLGLPLEGPSGCAYVVVVQAQCGPTPVSVGLAVDGVSEVLHMTAEDLQPSPDFVKGQHVPHVAGMAKVRGRLHSVLNVDSILSTVEVQNGDGLWALAQATAGLPVRQQVIGAGKPESIQTISDLQEQAELFPVCQDIL